MLINLPPYRPIAAAVAAGGGSDPFFKSVVANLHMDGTEASAVLTDIKGHAFTRNGNGSALSNAQKKFGSASLLLNRTGTTGTFSSSSTDYILGTGDFTIELWAYFLTLSDGVNARGLFQLGSGSAGGQVGLTAGTVNTVAVGLKNSNSKLEMYCAGGAPISTVDVALNQWHHVAMTRTGGVSRLFLNGVMIASGADTTNYTGGDLCIGSYWNQQHGFDGYLDEFRFTKGVCRYSANFVPTEAPGVDYQEPLWSQVRTLFHMDTNPPVDAKGTAVGPMSGKSYAISTTQKKFGTASLDLNANTSAYPIAAANTAGIFGTGDFCIEAWTYMATGDGNVYYPIYTNYSTWNGGGSVYFGRHGSYSGKVCTIFNFTGGVTLVEPNDPLLNQWVHYALVRKGTEIAIYRNGVKTVSATIGAAIAVPPTSVTTTPFAIGGGIDSYSRVQGYLDEVRITAGEAVYYNNFDVPTAAFTTPTDALASKVVTLWRAGDGYVDLAGRSTFTTKTVPITSELSKFGTPTARFAGTTATQLLSSAGTGGQVTDTGWTMEAWIYVTGAGGRVIFANQDTNYAGAFTVYLNNANKVVLSTNVDRMTSNAALALGQWHHIAIDKNAAATSNIWINGVLDLAQSGDFGGAYVGSGFSIGSRTTGNLPFSGAIDSVRITQAIRYTANFTPQQFAL